MATARCMNEDCERDEPWTLRKPVSEYQRGVTCPDCSTTRVEVEGFDETAPVRREEASQAELVEAGSNLAQATESAMAVRDADLPTGARLGALQQLLQKVTDGVGSLGEGYNNYRREKLAIQEDRITNLEIGDPELALECPRCGYEILPHEIPLQNDVMRCPGGCGKAIQLTAPQQA